ncbi:MAG: hypothetical protein K8R77_08045 [Anaerolineaceae bacterium]|nr:hypothetical protein [Anaerolineaceae bacterium]
MKRFDISDQTSRIIFFLVILVLVGLTLSVVSPAVQMTPGRDSGIYLYTGWQMLEGKTLYSEVWDHKPPVIFFIEAVGLWLGGGSVWGVWVLQVAFVFAAFLLAAVLLLQFSAAVEAGWVIAGGIFTLFYVLHGGNFTEEYALPFQIGALLMFFLAERKGYSFWRSFGIGLLLAMAFHLRQNLIGVGLVIGLVIVLQAVFTRNIRGLLPLLPMAAGFGLVAGLWTACFAVQGTLAEYWGAAFAYNFYYSDLGLLEYIKGIQGALGFFVTVPGFVVGAFAWMFLLVSLVLHFGEALSGWLRKRWPGLAGLGLSAFVVLLALFGEVLISGSAQDGLGLLQVAMLAGSIVLALVSGLHTSGLLARWLAGPLERQKLRFASPETALLAAVCLLWLPLEVLFIGLSARNYVHYFISLVPVTVVLIGLMQHWLLSLSNIKGFKAWPVMLVLLAVIAYKPAVALAGQFGTAGSDPQVDAAVLYIEENTDTKDPVLVWGAEPVVNLQSRRSLPTRYIHMYPFYVVHPTIEGMSAEFLADLKMNRPVLIVDTMNEELPFVTPNEDANTCAAPGTDLPGSMPQVFEQVCQNYEYITTVGPEAWRIYRLMDQ